jgi:hypothetical protein
MHEMRLRWIGLPLCAGLARGCETPQPVLESVLPKAAGNEGDVRLTILGRDLVPATILDPASGRRIATSEGFSVRVGKDEVWANLSDLAWLSAGALAATLPSAEAQRLPATRLDVHLTDPRGHAALLSEGFQELGRDDTGPELVFLSPLPETALAPGTVLRGSFRARKAAPRALRSLRWTPFEKDSARQGASCPVIPGAEQADCSFLFAISESLHKGDEVRIVAEASDVAKNTTRLPLSFILRDKPTIARISPDTGGTAGGTDVVILGTGFLPGSTASIGGQPLLPGGGTRVDDTRISGYTPAGAAGTPQVIVHTPMGDVFGATVFHYEPSPQLVAITPDHGGAAGGTAVSIRGANFTVGTRIYFGATLDEAVPLEGLVLQDATSVIGLTPAGRGVTTVWAFDRSLGFAKLAGGFTWSTP